MDAQQKKMEGLAHVEACRGGAEKALVLRSRMTKVV